MRWQPSATLAALQARAQLNSTIRAFFAERAVMEVETPLLCQAAGTDPNLDPLTALYRAFPGANPEPRYLQTSPEFAMKRLLAAGAGAIYQLTKAFRNGERGGRHNPEFTMLEWYRPGFSLEQLMAEVEALVASALGLPGDTCFERVSYRALFERHLAVDPHAAPVEALRELTLQRVPVDISALGSRGECLDLLYGHVIEPQLLTPVFIHDYPVEQAALARVTHDAHGQAVALRFELVIDGMELANGYDELSDAAEQARRLAKDRETRRQRDLPDIVEDSRLIAALQAGLPACAGVALGVDRLLMLRLGTRNITDVLSFPFADA